jgi:Flp pilus assembly protein TadB
MLVNPIGWGMLGAACVMMLVGFVWLKKVVKVEV